MSVSFNKKMVNGLTMLLIAVVCIFVFEFFFVRFHEIVLATIFLNFFSSGKHDECTSEIIVTIANISLPYPGVIKHDYIDAPLAPQVISPSNLFVYGLLGRQFVHDFHGFSCHFSLDFSLHNLYSKFGCFCNMSHFIGGLAYFHVPFHW